MPIIDHFEIPEYKRSKQHKQSPFRYPGGKYYGLKYILPFILSEEFLEYREPFVGGGCVFFALPKAKRSIINDKHRQLIDVYEALSETSMRSELIKMVSSETVTQERFDEVVAMVPQNLLDSAFQAFYLNRTAYSGILKNPNIGYNSIKSSPPKNWHKRMEPCGEKLHDVEIMSTAFENVINMEPTSGTVLMYLDPPYFEADQTRAYVESFTQEDHERLARVLKKTKHKFCLSYDNCEWVREAYSEFYMFPLEWNYNTDNISNSERKLGSELLITNYKPAWLE